MVLDGVRKHPDLDVLTFVEVLSDGGFAEEFRTYGDLLANGRGIAGALASEGMGDGAAFAIIMRNHAEFVDTMIGSEIAGTIFVPIDPRTRGEKLSYMLRFAECEGAFIADYALAHLMEILPDLPKLKWIWVLGDAGAAGNGVVRISNFEDALAGGKPVLDLPEPDLSRPMQLLYTSGTTGDPKAIVSTYGRFASVGALGAAIGLRPDDRPYTGLSLTHANAQLITLGNALGGGLRLVISQQFTKSRLWDILGHYECTMFSLLGGMALAIYAEPPALHDRAHKVRYVLSAGMPEALWHPFADRFGVEIFEFFGAAEGGLTLNPPGAGPAGSIGKPPPDSICTIFDEQGRECPAGTLGEICFRPVAGTPPPIVYLKDPEASAEKVRDGWFRTGDAGYKDADGWVYFAHRISNSIRRNGDFISASHIEAKIAALEHVADVHVYGLATSWNAPGEKEVIAAIVPQPDRAFDPRVVFAHCREQIGSNAVPSFVQIVDEIPKTASEKPQERFLVQMLTDSRSKIFNASGLAVTITPKGGQ